MTGDGHRALREARPRVRGRHRRDHAARRRRRCGRRSRRSARPAREARRSSSRPDLLRAYSRRGNFHSDPGRGRARSATTQLVAQGMQVAGPGVRAAARRVGRGLPRARRVRAEVRRARAPTARPSRRRVDAGDRRRDDRRSRTLTTGRTAVVGHAHRDTGRRRRDHARPPPLEHRVHLARARRARSGWSPPSRRRPTTSTGFFVLEDAVDAGDDRRARRGDRAVRPGGARVPAHPARRPVQHRRRRHRLDRGPPRAALGRCCATSARRRCSPTSATTSSGPTPGSTGSRRCTSSRTAPSRSSGTRTTATRTSSRRRTSRAGSRSPTRRSTTAASGCCPACTAAAPSRTSNTPIGFQCCEDPRRRGRRAR